MNEDDTQTLSVRLDREQLLLLLLRSYATVSLAHDNDLASLANDLRALLRWLMKRRSVCLVSPQCSVSVALVVAAAARRLLL